MKAVVFYELGAVTMEKIKEVYPRHKLRVDAFAKDGKVIAIGTFSNISEGSMGIFKNKECAEEFVEHDPFVLEGIVGKNLNGRYQQDAREWVKVKLNKLDIFVVCGYTAGTGWRASTFGALVLGKMTASGMEFVGEVGTGFNDRDIDEIFTAMRLLQTNSCPFSNNPYTNGGQPMWVTPNICIIVRYLEFTNSGLLRFPAYKGIVK